ncbi:MAG: hypothetical protein VXZ35_07160, partial [Pseudomonadota bacterium]|nr:hypothetical protein [Pseudomonadota bacterium]
PNGNKKAGIAKMKHFRNFVPKPTTSFSNKVMDLLGSSRLKFSVFTKLISGFDDLAKYQFKIGQSESPQCTFCKTGIGLPEIALPVLLLPAVNCQRKTKSRFKFTCGRLPVYVFLW